MRKLTIEVDLDELSVPGQNAVVLLLSDRAKKMADVHIPVTDTDPCQTAVDASSIARAARRFVYYLTSEKNGNQLRIIKAFVDKKVPFLSPAEMQASSTKKGPGLAGVLSSMTKNWRKAGMVGRKAIDWDGSTDGGVYALANGDESVLMAIRVALRDDSAFVASQVALK